MLSPELSGIAAHANPDGNLPRYVQPGTEAKPLAHDLAPPRGDVLSAREQPITK
jgi:hypothetical protein